MSPIVFIVLAAALIGLAFYLAALPLLKEARRQVQPAPVVSEQEHLAELMAQRDAAFQALRELSFDYKVGKITDEDFTAFEANLKQNAAADAADARPVGSRDRRRDQRGHGGSHLRSQDGPCRRTGGGARRAGRA